MSEKVMLPIIDFKSFLAISALKILHGKRAPVKVGDIADALSSRKDYLYEILMKLHGSVVCSQKGREGGYMLLKPDATVEEVCRAIGSTIAVQDDETASHLRVGMNRLMRTKIEDFMEN